MAQPKPINTRILLRNDTLANWNSSQLVLGKGEVAIATGLDGNLVEVRVGNGTTTWSGAAKLAVDASQISGIVELIQGTSKKYQIVANGEGGNSWNLQEAALSGGNWTTVSTFTVDFSTINTAINGLSADVDYLSGQISSVPATYATKTELTNAAHDLSTDYNAKIDATNATLNTVSSDYVKATDFATLSNDIGLSAARADNHVATKADIAALDGVMHFKGVVNAVPTATTGYNVGDVVLVTGSSVEGDNGKEFVLVNTGTDTEPVLKWEQIGDQDHYATKSYVDTGDNNTLTESKAYTDGKITDISGTITSTYATKDELTGSANGLSTDYNNKINALSDTYATKTLASQMSAYALEQANDYTDSKVAGLSNYYTKDEVDAISTALSTDYVGKIKAVNDKFANYALSADVDSRIAAAKSEVIGTTGDASSANTIYGAKKYADETSAYALQQATGYADALSTALSNTVSTDYIRHHEVVDTDLSGFFILSCGNATLREGEPPFNA